MNKWRLLLFSVFGLLQITTSDRNFIDGRYSCCDHSQRYSEADTRIISYEPYRVYRDVPDLQQRKLFGSSLSVRERDLKPPTRNVRQREVLSQNRPKERHAYERRSSRERNYDYNNSERDETRQDRLTRNRYELTSRFVDESRYPYKFNNGDRVNLENKNMREYVNNNDDDRRNLEKGLRNNERFVRERENSEESLVNTRRNFYSDSMPDNRLQPTSRNTDTNRRVDQTLLRRNTQVRNRSVTDENLRLVQESTQIKENQDDRRVISKRNLDSSRQRTSEELRRERNENRKRSSSLDSERFLDVHRQVFTQLKAMNTIAGHIKYSRELNEIHNRDISKTVSRVIRNVRKTETRERGQIIEQTDRRERVVNTIRTKQNIPEISETRDERNGPREYRAQDNFDYRQNRDNYQNIIQDMQRIRELTDVRSERMVLRERRDYDNGRDRSRDLLLLVRYRYSGSDDSRNNRNRNLYDNRHGRLDTRREEITRSQTNIRLENNDIRVDNNREDRINTKRQGTSMTHNLNERNIRELTDARQERETLRREHRYNIMRHKRYSSRLTDVSNDKLGQHFTNVIHEENIIREENNNQARRNIRQLVRDVSRINLRNDQRRELDDGKRERRAIRENNRQYTINTRRSSASILRTVNTSKRLDVQRDMNIINEELLISDVENIQEKRDFRRQEIRNSNNDRELKITSRHTLRNTQEVNFRRRIHEMSVRTDNILNVLSKNRGNLLETDLNTERMHKRQNIRQVDESDIRIASTLSNGDRAYNRIKQNDRGIRNVRTTEIRGSGQIIEQSDRRERDVNTIGTKQSTREISKIKDERNGPREYRAQDKFDYRQKRDNYRNIIQDTQRIRGLTDARSERTVLRERRHYDIDRDRSRNLLLLVRYRYSGYDDSRNNRNELSIFSRNIRKSYDEQYINRIDERTRRRESQSMDNLRLRRNERNDLRLHHDRSAEAVDINRAREDNEGLLRTVHERISMRTYRDEPKKEELRRTRSQSVTENCERRVNREEIFSTRTNRGGRYSEDSDVRRDTRRITAIAENRFRTTDGNGPLVPITYKPDTVTFEMKWQYLFYALQAMYLLSLLTKLPNYEEDKSKLRIITWLAPTKSLKME